MNEIMRLLGITGAVFLSVPVIFCSYVLATEIPRRTFAVVQAIFPNLLPLTLAIGAIWLCFVALWIGAFMLSRPR